MTWSREGTKKETASRPLIHYVFRPENTYETTFRGGKALGVRDLGKGESVDLVIPEQFTPYQRVYLGWDPDWTRNRSDWLDLAVNILGFVPFGMLRSSCRLGKWVWVYGEWREIRAADSRQRSRQQQDKKIPLCPPQAAPRQ